MIKKIIRKVRNKYFPPTKEQERKRIKEFEGSRNERVQKNIIEFLNDEYNIQIFDKSIISDILRETIRHVSSGHFKAFHSIEKHFLNKNKKYTKDHISCAMLVLVKSNILDHNCRIAGNCGKEHLKNYEIKIVEYFLDNLRNGGVQAEFMDIYRVFFDDL